MLEQDLAKTIVEWLHDMKWEVYQEVIHRKTSKRADIFAVRGNIRWAIECKTSLSDILLEQANYWIPYSNYTSIVTPGLTRASLVKNFWLEQKGIGWLTCDTNSKFVSICLNPKFRRNKIDIKLYEEQKTFAQAGNANSLFWSPWKRTCQEIYTFVNSHPGCTLKELFANIKHHYRSDSTARSCLTTWLRQGIIPGVRQEKIDRIVRLFPKKEES
jgi:hypothetical protein